MEYSSKSCDIPYCPKCGIVNNANNKQYSGIKRNKSFTFNEYGKPIRTFQNSKYHMMLDIGDGIPDQRSAIDKHSLGIPDQRSAMDKQSLNIPDQRSAIDKHSLGIPDQRSAIDKQSLNIPDQRSAMDKQSLNIPSNTTRASGILTKPYKCRSGATLQPTLQPTLLNSHNNINGDDQNKLIESNREIARMRRSQSVPVFGSLGKVCIVELHKRRFDEMMKEKKN